jgi:hypothetical protein
VKEKEMPDPVPQHLGGSFAPPLSDELLKKYKAMIDALDPRSQIRDAMEKLLACCGAWWELPDSKGTVTREHQVGPISVKGKMIPAPTIVTLEDAHQKALWEHIPWPDELKAMGKLFEKTIDPFGEKPLCDAAHHLLWHVCELNLDREPITSDKLGA